MANLLKLVNRSVLQSTNWTLASALRHHSSAASAPSNADNDSFYTYGM